jgi:His-Xaa-Ser system radical SAM maturase HxsB
MTIGLNRSFAELSYYQPGEYCLLPIRFLPLDRDRYIVSNIAGNYQVMRRPDLDDLVHHRLSVHSPLYDDLKADHFLADRDSNVYRDLLAAKYRTRQVRLPDFTSLHLFVVTLRCDHSCQYCQVSRVSEDRAAFDMSKETADRAIALMLESPSRQLKVEFQGGEPLLNFDLIRYIVLEVERLAHGREMQFVITSNLSPLTDEILEFAAAHKIFFSTSLDGPADLHNRNRPRTGGDSHARAISGIERIRRRLGHNAVAALMTSTAESLKQPEAIIDEYVRLGFDSIFLRFISPYGFAAKTAKRIGYETDEFIEFFKRGLAYIVSLNQRGIRIRETYSTLLLQRMLTPYATGYVDLQSPAGIGIGVLAYNYDGDVYAADEGRMLAEMGDQTFRLGSVRDSYEELFANSPLFSTISDTMLEGLPGCCDCALLPYCGSDPVFHHRTQGDVIGHRPTSAFCRRNMEIMRHLIRLLEDQPQTAAVLRTWI